MPFWQRTGFASYRAYIEAFEENQRAFGSGILSSVDPPGLDDQPFAELDADVANLAVELARRRRDQRQLGIRISVGDYERLTRIAKAHAMRPTTLARVMIRRGIAALDPEGERRDESD